MSEPGTEAALHSHGHVFLGADHESSERRTWVVIGLCGAMMVAEIIGGLLFGSIALVADGLHMSTHAGALLLAALAYSFARKHASDDRFTFGTGKLGDLAGFASAIVLAMIALLIGYESVSRLFQPVPIHFTEAIPIACLGLAVNVASAWILSRGGHHHQHGHEHHGDADQPDRHQVTVGGTTFALEIHEEGVPPRFRISTETPVQPGPTEVTVETERADGSRHVFAMRNQRGFLESVDSIPEPHAFIAHLYTPGGNTAVVFTEHAHGHAHRDNNMRAAIIHVAADAAVSILVIGGLVLARAFGWLWMDPLAGIAGSIVIASWSYGLVRDTGAILLDVNPDPRLAEILRSTLECDGDRVSDLHLWRVGPGHLAAVISVVSDHPRHSHYYRAKLAHHRILSHVTIEVFPRDAA